MSRREIDRALNAPRDRFPAETDCAVCGRPWLEHNGEICPICSICHRHGLVNHQPVAGVPVEVIEIGRVIEGKSVCWQLCRGGVTTFLPRLELPGFIE